MSKYILKKRIQKMAKYAHSIERGNKALYDFMYEACEMILNHAEDAKKALQIDNDIEKGIIEYFFPKKTDEKSCEKQRRNMYIRALKKLASAESLRAAEKMLDEKGVYTLSRNNKNEGVDDSNISEQTDDEPKDIQNIKPPTKNEFRTLLKQRNALKKSVIILKYEDKYIAVTGEEIHEKICKLIKTYGAELIPLFDEG